LQKALTQFDAFVYVLTPASVTSEACQLEFVTAVEMRLPVVLVMLERVDLPLFLNRYSYIDLTGYFTAESTAALLGELHVLSRETTLKELLEAPPKRKGKEVPHKRWQFVAPALVVSLVAVSLVVFSIGIMSLTQTSRERLIITAEVGPFEPSSEWGTAWFGSSSGGIFAETPGIAPQATALPIQQLPSIVSVCPTGCEFSQIGTALEYVEPGGTINIGPGVYEEDLSISKDVTLQGAGAEQTLITPPLTRTGIVINSMNPIQVRFQNFTGAGITTRGRAELSLTNMVIRGSYFTALSAEDETKVTITNSFIADNILGIQVSDEAQVTVVDSRIFQ
jgi:hypothetical protein